MASEAKTLTDTNAVEVANWCGGVPVVQHNALDHDKTTQGVNVPTYRGVERATEGDMVIRRNDGKFEIFKQD